MGFKKVHIPEPCHENWDLMSSTEKGRHCEKCAKEVVDFTPLNPEQFNRQLTELSKSSNHVCGMFSSDQVQPTSVANEIIWINYLHVKLNSLQIFAFAFVFAFFLGGFASCKISGPTMGVIKSDNENTGLSSPRLLDQCNSGRTLGPIVTRDSSYADSIIKKTEIILAKIHFDSGKSKMKNEDYQKLKILSDSLEKYTSFTIEISGHTDSIGSKKYNQKLALSRVNEVQKALNSMAIFPEKVYAVDFQYPLANNGSMAGRKQNRRVEIKITGTIDEVIPKKNQK